MFAYQLLLVCLSTISCFSQSEKNKFDWINFESKQADIKVKVPCELKERQDISKQKNPSISSFNYSCQTADFRILVMLTESSSKDSKVMNLSNLLYMPDDLKGVFPNITSVETKEIVRNGDEGRLSDYSLSNNDRIKKLILIGDRGIYNIMIYVPRNSNQQESDFENYYKSLTVPIIESFEIVSKK